MTAADAKPSFPKNTAGRDAFLHDVAATLHLDDADFAAALDRLLTEARPLSRTPRWAAACDWIERKDAEREAGSLAPLRWVVLEGIQKLNIANS